LKKSRPPADFFQSIPFSLKGACQAPFHFYPILFRENIALSFGESSFITFLPNPYFPFIELVGQSCFDSDRFKEIVSTEGRSKED
jgi:hypothetical protein